MFQFFEVSEVLETTKKALDELKAEFRSLLGVN